MTPLVLCPGVSIQLVSPSPHRVMCESHFEDQRLLHSEDDVYLLHSMLHHSSGQCIRSRNIEGDAPHFVAFVVYAT